MINLVSIVIPNWNGLKYLEECLFSLTKQTYKNYEIILVDNNSSDGSIEYIEKNYPNVNIIKNSTNFGFAKATNIGIRHSKGVYIAALNNDTKVDPNWLKELVNVIELNPDIGSCQSKILNYYKPNLIDSTGIRMFKSFTVTDRGRGEIDRGQYNSQEEIFGACAAAALYKKEMLCEIGLFDEDFFAYMEDVDLAWRGRLASWRSMYVPTSIVYHFHSATSGHKSPFSRYFGSRNRIWCIIKNASYKELLYYIPIIFIWDLVDVSYGIVKYRDFAQLKGKISAIVCAKKNISKRKKFNHFRNYAHAEKLMEPIKSMIMFEHKKLSSKKRD